MPALIRASRALRIVLRERTDLDATEVIAASRRGTKSTMLAFVAPARDVDHTLLTKAGAAAHNHLPMVIARLRALGAPSGRQYLRITRNADGEWYISIAQLRVVTNGRLAPVKVQAVVLHKTPSAEQLELAVEIACRRAKLALEELDPSSTEAAITATLDKLIVAEAELLRSQFGKR